MSFRVKRKKFISYSLTDLKPGKSVERAPKRKDDVFPCLKINSNLL